MPRHRTFAPRQKMPTQRSSSGFRSSSTLGVSFLPARQLAPKLPPARGSAGRSLPATVREPMEQALHADFSRVRVHEGPEALVLGAAAFARGENLFFSPGRFAPATSKGRKLLAHELAHVVQQREGRVPGASGPRPTLQQIPSLEREADHLADRTRSHRTGRDPGGESTTPDRARSANSSAIQCVEFESEEEFIEALKKASENGAVKKLVNIIENSVEVVGGWLETFYDETDDAEAVAIFLEGEEGEVLRSFLFNQGRDDILGAVSKIGNNKRGISEKTEKKQKKSLGGMKKKFKKEFDKKLSKDEVKVVGSFAGSLLQMAESANDKGDNSFDSAMKKAESSLSHKDCNNEVPGEALEELGMSQQKETVTVAIVLGILKEYLVNQGLEGEGTELGKSLFAFAQRPFGIKGELQELIELGSAVPDFTVHRLDAENEEKASADNAVAVLDLKFPCPSEEKKQFQWGSSERTAKQFDLYLKRFEVDPIALYPAKAKGELTEELKALEA